MFSSSRATQQCFLGLHYQMIGNTAEVDPLEATMLRDLHKPFSKGEMVYITQRYLMRQLPLELLQEKDLASELKQPHWN